MKAEDAKHNQRLVLQTPSKYSHRCCSSRRLCWVFLWYLLACLCLDLDSSNDVFKWTPHKYFNNWNASVNVLRDRPPWELNIQIWLLQRARPQTASLHKLLCEAMIALLWKFSPLCLRQNVSHGLNGPVIAIAINTPLSQLTGERRWNTDIL